MLQMIFVRDRWLKLRTTNISEFFMISYILYYLDYRSIVLILFSQRFSPLISELFFRIDCSRSVSHDRIFQEFVIVFLVSPVLRIEPSTSRILSLRTNYFLAFFICCATGPYKRTWLTEWEQATLVDWIKRSVRNFDSRIWFRQDVSEEGWRSHQQNVIRTWAGIIQTTI